jgi:hypothetical protein
VGASSDCRTFSLGSVHRKTPRQCKRSRRRGALVPDHSNRQNLCYSQKKDTLALVHKRIDALAKSLSALDDADDKVGSLANALEQSTKAEVELIGKDSTAADDLVKHRAKTDLLAGKHARAKKAVLVAEEQAVRDANTAAQLIYQVKNASISAYFYRVREQSAAYFDEQDWNLLKSLAGRSDLG